MRLMNKNDQYLKLTGRDQTDLQLISNYYLSPAAAKSFLLLQQDAQEAGFDLQIISAFRSYDDQFKIWNEKAMGKRDLLDMDGFKLKYESLTKQEVLLTIMRWSAIPGASRHHWGTDLDIYDKKSLPSEDYQVQLIPKEVRPNGIFGKLHAWLDEKMSNNESHGFYRPYCKDQGGVAPERWHLSYAPESVKCLEDYTLEVFKKNIRDSRIELKELILKSADDIHKRYVRNVSVPPF